MLKGPAPTLQMNRATILRAAPVLSHIACAKECDPTRSWQKPKQIGGRAPPSCKSPAGEPKPSTRATSEASPWLPSACQSMWAGRFFGWSPPTRLEAPGSLIPSYCSQAAPAGAAVNVAGLQHSWQIEWIAGRSCAKPPHSLPGVASPDALTFMEVLHSGFKRLHPLIMGLKLRRDWKGLWHGTVWGTAQQKEGAPAAEPAA